MFKWFWPIFSLGAPVTREHLPGPVTWKLVSTNLRNNLYKGLMRNTDKDTAAANDTVIGWNKLWQQ